MKGVGYWAIFSGVLIVLVAAGYPYVLEWQLHDTLARFSSESAAPALAEELAAERVWARVIALCLGFASLAAGFLLLRGHRHGWYVWLAVCATFIGMHGLDLLGGGRAFPAIFWGLWWFTVGAVSVLLLVRGAKA
jgi:hypothetical protein